MLFSSPIYFSLLIFIALFILMYFFRKKYVERIVPTNFLWEEAMKEQTASPYLKKLQKNLLFFLQLIILLLLIALLVQPSKDEDRIIASEVVMVMDVSASMDREGHVQKTIENALEQLDRMDTTSITLVETGSTPKVVFYQESNKREIQNYLKDLQLNYEIDNMDKTFSLVKSLVSGKQIPIFIFSDDISKEDIRKNFMSYQVHVFNTSMSNIASINSFVVAKTQVGLEAFVSIENYLQQPILATLNIYSNEKLVSTKNIELTNTEIKGFVIDDIPEGKYYKAQIELNDSYEIDNEMYFISPSIIQNIFIKDDVHLFVQKAVKTMFPEAKSILSNDLATNGVLVTNQLDLDSKLPIIYLHKGTSKVELATLNIKKESDSLLDFVDLNNVLFTSAFNDLSIPNKEVLVSSENAELILKGRTTNNVPIIALNFDVVDSDWPLHISFPVFFYNAISFLKDETSFSNVTPNQVISLAKTSKVSIFGEEGSLVANFDPTKETIYSPNQPGIYQLVVDDDIYFFSVNIDASEKKVLISEDFIWNENVSSAEEIKVERSNDYLQILIVFAFMLLLIEWGVYVRDNRI